MFIEGEELDEEGGEEEEGIDYADELPAFDEEAYYEGVVRTITGHFESLGLNVETELKIKYEKKHRKIEKIGNRLKINFYA